MKKIILLFTVFSLTTAINAQDINASLSVGPVTGDFKNIINGVGVKLNLSGELNYLSPVSESFTLGATAGYSQYMMDDELADAGVDDLQFANLGAVLRYNLSEKFALGGDLGFAFGINDDNDGGFYYAPKVLLKVSETLAITASYKTIVPKVEDNSPFQDLELNSYNFGIEFKL